MPAKTGHEDVEELYKQIHRGAIESGEWDRTIRQAKQKLAACGWADAMKDQAKEQCRNMPKLNLRALEEQLGTTAQDSVPPAVKEEILLIIRAYIEDNLGN